MAEFTTKTSLIPNSETIAAPNAGPITREPFTCIELRAIAADR